MDQKILLFFWNLGIYYPNSVTMQLHMDLHKPSGHIILFVDHVKFCMPAALFHRLMSVAFSNSQHAH